VSAFDPLQTLGSCWIQASMSRNAPAVLALLLTSCTSRPETKDYFTKVTGLRLCEGATVRNVNADSPDRSPGFDSVYIVDVTMPASCRSSFLTAVGQRIGARCNEAKRCSGNANNGDFYSVEARLNGFRVTHST
jgi:hypothetical protein